MSSESTSTGSFRLLDMERGKKILQEWLNLTEEERVSILKKVLDGIKSEFEKDPAKGTKMLIAWLLTEDGAIMSPYIFKPQYRKEMVDLIHALIKTATYTIISFSRKEKNRK